MRQLHQPFYSRIISSFFLFFICLTLSAQDFRKIDNWLEEHAPEMGGRAVLMIYKNGKIVYSNSVNEMSRRQKMAGRMIARRKGREADLSDFSVTTRQPIASCSKWLSAALVMTFADEGKLKLDDTIGKFLPVMSQHGKGNITISQCLSHTTGIKTESLKESLNEMRSTGSMDEAVLSIARLPMEGEPGKVFRYSNAGLQLAAAVIEKISGSSFETLFSERIAKPLNMRNTDFGKGKVPLPAGGALSTPQDYMQFLAMILNKGVHNGKRILSEKSIAEMQVNRITGDVKVAYSPAEAGDAGYGYGEWVMETSKIGNLSTTVSSPGLFGSFPWVQNERGYCAFLMTKYIKSNGRGERYNELKALVNEVLK
ncbi:MAG TPA: serine hydrolase domain-containing protein [Chitinophagaceae bacterium]